MKIRTYNFVKKLVKKLRKRRPFELDHTLPSTLYFFDIKNNIAERYRKLFSHGFLAPF